MFEIGDCIFVDKEEHKHYTITAFYNSVSNKDCAYIKPTDGVMPRKISNSNNFYSRQDVCGVLLKRLTHTTTLALDWEV